MSSALALSTLALALSAFAVGVSVGRWAEQQQCRASHHVAEVQP